MSEGRFVTFGSPYSRDHQREQWYRQQEAERQERELVERSARWIAGKLAGREFTSLLHLTDAATQFIEQMQDGMVDTDMALTIHRACVLLWMGAVDRDSLYRRCVEKAETGIRFIA